MLCPSPEELPDSGIELGSPALQADSLRNELLGNPHLSLFNHCCLQLKHPFTQQMLLKEQYVSATVFGAASVKASETDVASDLLGLIVHWN